MKAIEDYTASDILSVRHEMFFKSFVNRWGNTYDGVYTSKDAEERYIVRMADKSILRFKGNREILPDAIKEFIDSHIRKLVCAGEDYTAYEWTKSERKK